MRYSQCGQNNVKQTANGLDRKWLFKLCWNKGGSIKRFTSEWSKRGVMEKLYQRHKTSLCSSVLTPPQCRLRRLKNQNQYHIISREKLDEEMRTTNWASFHQTKHICWGSASLPHDSGAVTTAANHSSLNPGFHCMHDCNTRTHLRSQDKLQTCTADYAITTMNRDTTLCENG